MPISHKHGFAFVHVPKTGGESIVRALTTAGVDFSLSGFGLWDILSETCDPGALVARLRRAFPLAEIGTFPQQHLPAALLPGVVSPNVWDRLFSFALVRNPWDMMVSSYVFFKQHTRRVEQTGADRDRVEMARRCDSFERFVHFYPAMRSDTTEMLIDENGAIGIDFVGRFERIGEDFRTVCERIGIGAELPHLNATGHRSYRDYYTDATRKAVARHFARDIDRFSYSF